MPASSRKFRLASGLVLMAYVAGHLANHALGLVSLQAAEAGRLAFVGFWRHPLATAALYAALAIHVVLALAAVHQHRTWRMPAGELLRIALGFAIPLLLANHIAATRVAHALDGMEDSYRAIVAAMGWGKAVGSQVLLMAMAWLHGCMGIHFAYRHRARYAAVLPLLAAVAAVLPVLAATGTLAMLRELQVQGAIGPQAAREPGPVAAWVAEAGALAPLVLLAGVLLARWGREQARRRAGPCVAISYPGRVVEVPAGWTVLEASRAAGIPHLSLCGGRARCSTCRIHVQAEPGTLPPPSADEARTLARIGHPPGVRLACQLRPQAPLAVRPLLAAAGDAAAAVPAAGEEREVVVLFADLRRWTGLAEQHLPLDLVYLLDRYFAAVGEAVREAGGVPNQFIGDSVMALFGLQVGPVQGARDALAAAAAIERRMQALDAEVLRDFGRRLDFGIGLHAGLAAVGSVGWRDTRTLTAVGDAVNTASRLQELTKEFGVRMVVSDDVLRHAGRAPGAWPAHEITLRGRRTSLRVYAVSSPAGA